MSSRKFLLPGTLATLTLTGCWNDPNTYPFSLAETKERLSSQKLTYFYKEKASHLTIKRAHGNSLMVTINSPDNYRRSECVIMLEAVDETSTRLVPECGESDNEYRQESYEAIENTIAEKARVILLGEDADAGQAAS